MVVWFLLWCRGMWCLSPLPCRSGAPLSLSASWCCACRGLWLCPLPRASLARVGLLPYWRGTLLLFLLLRRSLPFPLLTARRPSFLACIFSCLPCVLVCGSASSFAYLLVLLVLSVVCGHRLSPPSLLLGPVTQGMDGCVSCCGSGGCDYDIRTYTSLAVVSTLRRQQYLLGAPSVASVCVAVSRLSSIPRVRRWRPLRARLWIG